MKTFTKTFSNYVAYVAAINFAVQRQFKLIENEQGYEYIAWGEKTILINPEKEM